MSPRTAVPIRPATSFLFYQLVSWGLLAALGWYAVPGIAGLGTALVVAAALYTTLPLLVFLRGGGGWRRYPTALFRLAVVRAVLYAQLLLPFVTTAALVGLIGGAFAGQALPAARIAAFATLVAGVGILLLGWFGSRALVIREVEASVPGLPPSFDGLRIAQVSDTHMGPQTSACFMDNVTRALHTLQPDVVTVTGDLVDDRAEDVDVFAEWLTKVRHGNKSGHRPDVFLIPGNHDVYAGWYAVASGLRRQTDARVLVNESTIVERNGERLAIVGIGDPAGGRSAAPESGAPDIPRALALVPRDVPVVAFAHNPMLWPALAERGVALTLSGHTHWGQFAFPRRGWSLASPFLEHAMGVFQRGDSLLYVHPGTGFWGIPFRLGAFPEIALVTLRRSEASRIAMGKPKRSRKWAA